VLTLDDLSAGYGAGNDVLVEVNVAVAPSSVVALLGPNGAGKTTLLRVASGLLGPRSGTVTIDGEDATKWSTQRRTAAGVCLVPEGRGIFATLTVRENIHLFSPRGVESESVEKAVDAFPELKSRMGQLAGTLSGGEQQMLALSRAYMQQPRYVLLDEVSMGLAPLIVERIFQFIARLASDGAALLLVEQYVTRALDMADQVYVLSRGHIAFSGRPDELDKEHVFAQYIGVAGESLGE
jgi:branched-chain amino acid transport system ATP-binding protein